jgi:hypothetical protein
MPKGNNKQSSKKVVVTTVAAKTSRASTLDGPAVSEAAVAVRAFEIYMGEGQPEGRHLEHWQRARSELGLS